jgi:hypothetical protein
VIEIEIQQHPEVEMIRKKLAAIRNIRGRSVNSFLIMKEVCQSPENMNN